MLALPGSAYLYQGEELGLPEVVDLPDSARQDPTFARTAGESYGRDGCRVPIPWEAAAPAAGFSPSGEAWLPQPGFWPAYARDVQRGVPGSTLEFYRAALAARRDAGLATGRSSGWMLPPTSSRSARQASPCGRTPGSPRSRSPRARCCSRADRSATACWPGDTTVWVR